MSYETRYAANMRAKAERKSNTPEAKAARVRLSEALQRAKQDRKSKFPNVTEKNYDAAVDYQDERIAYWRKELNA